jgi:Flp pilus assembly protein TadG
VLGKTINLPRLAFRRFRKSEDASVAIEFGFIAPVFFLLLFTFIETAAMMFQEYAIQAGVHEAARLIRTGQAQNAGMGTVAFKQKICATAKVVSNCESKLRVHVNSKTTFSQMETSVPNFNAVGTDSAGAAQNQQFTCGAPQQVVAVIATYDYEFVFPIMKFFANTSSSSYRRLTATAMFRNEPFTATATCAAS